MPGLKKSPGMADIDVCYGAHKAGSDGVQIALRKARWTYEQTPLQRGEKLDLNRFSDVISSPEDGFNGGEALDDVSPSSAPEHEEVENNVSPLSRTSSVDGRVHLNGDDDGISSREQEALDEELIDDTAPSSPSVSEKPTNMSSSPSKEIHLNGTTDLKERDYRVSPSERERNVEEANNDAVPSSSYMREEHAEDISSPSNPAMVDKFDPEELRLPPTPPNLNNSEDAAQNRDVNTSQQPLLADDIRTALPSKHSGQTMTPVNQPASPPTPDPSPPRKREEPSTSFVMEEKPKQQFLMPGSFVTSEHELQGYASSLAESYKTAQEDHALRSNASLSPVHLPENDRLPTHWLDSTRDLQSASIGLSDITVQQTPQVDNVIQSRTMDAISQHRDNQSGGITPAHSRENSNYMKQYAEDRNNIVYKRLQEENIARHSAVSANSGPITVGISIPSNELTPRTLKRRMKRSSLRMDTSDDDNRDGTTITDSGRTVTGRDTSKHYGLGIDNSQTVASNGSNKAIGSGIAGGRTLKQRKARELDKNSILTESPLFGRSTLDDSPIFSSNIRQVSSPARLGPDTSDMTALTYASMQDSPTARRAPESQAETPHKLRHVSYEDRLSRNMSVRRTSLEASPPARETTLPSLPAKKVMNNISVKRTQVATSPGESGEHRSPSGTLRRFSRGERLENNSTVRRTSLDQTPQSPPQVDTAAARSVLDKEIATASPRKSMDARNLYPTTTPGSMSVFSDRTENIEIGEANGIRLYPHNNDSLLVIQHGSRSESADRDASEAPNFYDPESHSTKPIFTACIEPPTPILAMTKPAHQVDSPLTNPRAAPEPPSFKVIPPTPERELDMQLGIRPQVGVTTITKDANPPPERLSLVQRARRYSDIMFPNLGTLRKSNTKRDSASRATHLSPLWRPQGFWDEFDSEDEFNDYEPAGSLPRGGDTSNVDEVEAQKRGLFPRAMSKRLPGFRGSGGFLQGNSLGIDRHGTNNRRHYVSTGTRTLSKRQSEELVRNLSSNTGSMSPEHRMVKTRGIAYWMGARKFRAKMRAVRLRREEKERERRREQIRKSIGFRLYHNGQTQSVGV